MSNNTTDGDFVEEVPTETFHIYILSFSYGFLLLIILGHLIIRWKWRRVKVSHFPNHYPGDKSFKCKAIRRRLCTDFATIATLSPSPELINEKYEPKMFGACEGGEAFPGHWYRMKACEAAATFVSMNDRLVRHTHTPPMTTTTTTNSHRHTRIKALPSFITNLRENGSLQVNSEEEERLIERACDLYAMARFKDGVFPMSLFEELSRCLHGLQSMLQSSTSTETNPLVFNFPDPGTSFSSNLQLQYDLDPMRMSQEPLLALSSIRSEDVSLVKSPEPVTPHQSTSSRPRSRKTSKQELSPLILVESQSLPDSSLLSETPV